VGPKILVGICIIFLVGFKNPARKFMVITSNLHFVGPYYGWIPATLYVPVGIWKSRKFTCEGQNHF